MHNRIDVTDFFNSEYLNFSHYDNYRKLPSIIDGLKPSGRKVLYTTLGLSKSAYPLKVSSLMSKTSDKTNYLHGEQSLYGVTVNLAQHFTGTNNIPLLTCEGIFGSRLSPTAAASRYIFTQPQPYIDKLIVPDDTDVLIEQVFEGDIIEPQFFLPTLPLAVINPIEGLTIGFRSTVFPRNPNEVAKYILGKLDGKNPRPKLLPHYNGFNGTIELTSPGSFIMKGCWNRLNATTIIINEVPINFDRKSFEKKLIKLEDEKVIKDFKDLCYDDNFHFEVSVTREFSKKSDAEITKILNLSSVLTERLVFVSEDNKIVTFDTVKDVIDHFIDVKLSYTQKRIDAKLVELKKERDRKLSIITFIANVNCNKIVLNVSDTELIRSIKKVENIVPIDGNFDYLLKIPVRSLTNKRAKELVKQYKELLSEIKVWETTTPNIVWGNDIKELLIGLKNAKL